jgi:exonuclease SbcC
LSVGGNLALKKIKLEKLTLKNFKGIKELTLDFNDGTDIKGDNGTGKTTIIDGFTWFLFDKDSNDRQNFDIKTLDCNNNVIHGLDHEVIGVIAVNEKVLTFRKIFREKWTKKKGEAERQLTGHETIYYIDDMPIKQSEYKAKINSIIEEGIFKFITNPLYFSTMTKWQERRKIILEIIGDIPLEAVVGYKNNLRELPELLGDKDVDTLKKSITIKIKKLNEHIRAIPYRIDELNNSICEVDYYSLDFKKRGVITAIESVDEKLIDKSKINDELLRENDKIYSLKTRVRELEYNFKIDSEKGLVKLKEEVSTKENEIYVLERKISKVNNTIQTKEVEAKTLEDEIEKLRRQWTEVDRDALVIKKDVYTCSACERDFDEKSVTTKVEEVKLNFKKNKKVRLQEISATGRLKKEKITEVEEDIADLKGQLGMSNGSLKELKSILQKKEFQVKSFVPKDGLEEDLEYKEILKEIAELEGKINAPKDFDSQIQELKKEKIKLNLELEEVNRQINSKEQNERLKDRIKELSEEERAIAMQIAELESQEFLCDEFIKTKVELLEERINKKFKFVTFKMFNTLVNGAIEECCEALINGVPFGSANKASQINGGLDIINALSEYYDVQAPIFIDNRESINQIVQCDSQIINLRVSHDDKLIIESEVD